VAVEGLTACLIARDERANLASLLPDVVAVADETVVVDTGSSDNTIAVAHSLGARVLEIPWEDDFAGARNRGLAEVRTSHALWLDADDRVTRNDLVAIRDGALARPERALDLILVEEHEDPDLVASCWQLRVVPARDEHRFERRVHEDLRPSVVRAGTPISRLPIAVRHLGRRDAHTRHRKACRDLPLLARDALRRPDDAVVQLHLARTLAQLGRAEDAIQAARRCLALGGVGADVGGVAAALLARLELERDRADEAERVLGAARARRPDDASARFLRAEARLRRGDVEGALRDLAAARTAPIARTSLPTPVAGLARAVRARMAQVLGRLGRGSEAAAILGEALDSDPTLCQAGTDPVFEHHSKGRALRAAVRLPGARRPARGASSPGRELPILTEAHRTDGPQVR
jgi:hypothetical protein